MKCKFCNKEMINWEGDTLELYCVHDDVVIIYVGNFAICKGNKEIFVSNKQTQLNRHFREHDKMFALDNYFSVPETILRLPYPIDVTPENFDYWVKKLESLVIFS